MNIVLTGSLGHISKPLAETLVQKGHRVTVISSRPQRKTEIEALGAKAAIGTMQDPGFLAATFKGADMVYLMEAFGHNSFFDPDFDYVSTIDTIVRHYKQAVHESGVKQLIHLSSIGAHTSEGNGMLAFHYRAEKMLNSLPADVHIKFMRPVGFYYNMFAFISTIKTQGMIVQNYGGDEKEPWVAPADIAAVIAEEMEKPFEGRTVRYIASDEASPNEVAQILGKAIGRPGLTWQVIPDEQLLGNMLAAGMNAAIAKGLVEMNAGRRNGILYQDYYLHRPVLGPTRLTDFARAFAAVYQNNQ